MKWLQKEPALGDIVRVKFNEELYHYGIYASDEEIIQFGLAPNRRTNIKDSEVVVLRSNLDSFLAGGTLEVSSPDPAELSQKRPPSEVVDYARSKIGRGGYNILYNNCEHFANECYLGRSYCSKADFVREMFRKIPVVDVYVARIPNADGDGEILPAQRAEEIASVTNPGVRREKYYAWRLLEYGLERSLGLKIGKMEFAKTPFGKWVSPSCKFSISHSGCYVAVAISRAEVGVDVEQIQLPRSERFAERILTASELDEYNSLPDGERVGYLISAWTAKEAIFKTTDRECFIPSDIELGEKKVKLFEIGDGKSNYILAVSTDTPEKIRLFKNIDLVKK